MGKKPGKVRFHIRLVQLQYTNYAIIIKTCNFWPICKAIYPVSFGHIRHYVCAVGERNGYLV